MRTKRKLFAVLGVAVIVLGVALAAVACEGDDDTYTIGITQIATHDALDDCREGFIAALADAGYVDGENITLDAQNAQGEVANAALIAQKFVADDVDMIFAIATDTAQAAVNATDGLDLPVVFGAITDPVYAKLLVNDKEPEANVTGCSDKLPIQPHLDLIMDLVPDAKTIGLIYSAGEANSVVAVTEEKALAEAMGLKTVEATAANTSEVLAAAQSLVGRVDAISVLTDNTVVEAIASVVGVCEENDIPLVAGDISTVEKGAVAAWAFNYYDHGYMAGEMAVKVLEGTAISELPVEYSDEVLLAVNPAAAEAMGITIPDDLADSADVTVEDADDE